MIKVSVIIPFYRNYEWLVEAVESVKNQTFNGDVEVIIVDDGSGYDISSIKRLSSNIDVFYKENGGPGSARNYGISKAQGKYIAFLDSDDYWQNDKLEKQISFMEENNADFSCTEYTYFGFNSNKTEKIVDFEKSSFKKAILSCPIATPTVIVRRALLIDNNFLFSEDMRYGQDIFLWLNILSEYNVSVLQESLCMVRLRGSNASVQARIHLRVRGELYDLFLRDYFRKKSHNYLVKINYFFCYQVDTFVKLLERKLKSKKTVELLSKILYLPMYLLFKFMRVVT